MVLIVFVKKECLYISKEQILLFKAKECKEKLNNKTCNDKLCKTRNFDKKYITANNNESKKVIICRKHNDENLKYGKNWERARAKVGEKRLRTKLAGS